MKFGMKRTIFSTDPQTDAALDEIVDGMRDALIDSGTTAPTSGAKATLFFIDTTNKKLYVNANFPLPAASDSDWQQV